MKTEELGIAVVGSGRIGSLRASMASSHPAVRFLAVSDLVPEKARNLAENVKADLSSGDNLEIISHPEVNAVIVSTSEHEHLLPITQALQLGKPVLVEKPLALTIEDADRIIAVAEETETPIRVGYAQRFKRCFLSGKEQIDKGRVGNIVTICARMCNTAAQGVEILKRSPHATPVLDVLTYWVDMACWYMEGVRPVEVVARGAGSVFKKAGYQADDTTWTLITFENGEVANLGVFYALPSHFPGLGQGVRFEVYGTEGALLLDEDHKDELLVTNVGIPHAYIPDLSINTAFLSSSSPGNWLLGDYWGPVADETRVWLDHLSRGRPCPMATIYDARTNLELTLAIEKSAATGEIVPIPS